MSSRLVGLAQLARTWGTTPAQVRRTCHAARIKVVRAPAADGSVAHHIDARDVPRLRRELEAVDAVPIGLRRPPPRPLVDLRQLPIIGVDTCWGPELG